MIDISPIVIIVALLLVITSVFIYISDFTIGYSDAIQSDRLLYYSLTIENTIYSLSYSCLDVATYIGYGCFNYANLSFDYALSFSVGTDGDGPYVVISYGDYTYRVNLNNLVAAGLGVASYAVYPFYLVDKVDVFEGVTPVLDVIVFYERDVTCDLGAPPNPFPYEVYSGILSDKPTLFIYIKLC